MRDYKAFKFLSDHEGDKIIYFYEGSFDATAGPGLSGMTITHDLGFAPLLIGYWATNADFSDSRPFNYGFSIQDHPNIVDTVECNTRDDGDILVSLMSKVGNFDRVYFRLFGFMPTTVDVAVPQTAMLTNGNFIFNTKYKYSKLYKSGVGSNSFTITHNFGYLPRVLTWHEVVSSMEGIPTTIAEASSGQTPGDGLPAFGVIVTNDSVTFRANNLDTRIHYRIYYDEA